MAKNLKILFPALAAALLSACAGGALKSDLVELRAAALQAYMQGDLATAERDFLELTRRVPGEGESWFRLGNIYARTRRPEAAIQAYQEALLRQYDKPKAWHNMGIVYLREAGNAFTQLLMELDPDDPFYPRIDSLNEAVINLLNSAAEGENESGNGGTEGEAD
jgi:cytochrome c-type biogenesis protein CcmH/NrfG